MTSVKEQHEIRNDFLVEVMQIAVEGPINYWAEVQVRGWGGKQPYVKVWEVADETTSDEEQRYGVKNKTILPSDLAVAMMNICNPGNKFRLNDQCLTDIALANIKNDALHLDATSADVIMQVAVLGEVKYG